MIFVKGLINITNLL